MNGFTKLHKSIIYSSVWEEDNYTRILWITMLAMANSDGEVIVAFKRLYKVANIPADKCRIALDKLSAPDADSRTSDNEGCRIARIQGGWAVLNYHKYRATKDEIARRKQNREAKRRERERKKQVPADVSICQHDVSNVSQNQPIVEAEAEAEADKRKSKERKSPAKQQFLECVFMTPEQHARLVKDFDAKKIADYIQRLNDGIMSKGYKYKSHSHTIRNWIRRDEKKGLGTKLFPIAGKLCSQDGCGVPAIWKSTGGAYDFYYCKEHIPEKTKVKMREQGYDI